MSSLHMSKVAVGCASIETLARRQQLRAVDGIVPITTRFKPKRADELIGGSLYWIIKHRVTARQTIIGFDEGEDRRTIIRVDARLVLVRALPKRAHQGWRYLDAKDAPIDWDGSEEDGLAALPPMLASKLSALMLI